MLQKTYVTLQEAKVFRQDSEVICMIFWGEEC
jgi:hypothetical protein